jgi:hypothetical protein
MASRRRVLIVLGYDPEAHPGLALRAQATEAIKLSGDGTRWEWRCPFCGSRARGKVRPGQVAGVRLEHEPWCPVVTNEEVTR